MVTSTPKGLCVPLVTPMTAEGSADVVALRGLMRHVSREARILFLCGTTGEWNRLDAASLGAAIAAGVDEGKRIGGGLSAWIGVNAASAGETLTAAETAARLGADALVVAPLAVPGIEIIPFFERDLARAFDRAGRAAPVYLYDNADIAIDPHIPHLRTRDVKRLSRLPWIAGIKVSAPRTVLGNYAKAAANWREDFRIFAGHPAAIFEIFAPRRGVAGALADWWNRYLLHYRFPAGIVAGTANLAPGLWRRAWEACLVWDDARMAACREATEALNGLSAFTGPDGKVVRKTIACLKEGLRLEGAIPGSHVAKGTKPLTLEEARLFAERWAGWKKTYGNPVAGGTQ